LIDIIEILLHSTVLINSRHFAGTKLNELDELTSVLMVCVVL